MTSLFTAIDTDQQLSPGSASGKMGRLPRCLRHEGGRRDAGVARGLG
jgi:hypothetical protein